MVVTKEATVDNNLDMVDDSKVVNREVDMVASHMVDVIRVDIN